MPVHTQTQTQTHTGKVNVIVMVNCIVTDTVLSVDTYSHLITQ